tara:strand:- start:1023 stop:1502 length:480 start_codon:yes stop_codon:yes gene_type:complete
MGRQPKISQYGSVDPAPPQISGQIIEWKESLVNKDIPMFQRMRNVFALRNDRTDEACLALCNGFMSDSALLRHEVAYVLGQMQNKVAIPKLIEVLSNEQEHVMVRHEAAEALGAIGDYSVIPVLQKYLNHQLPEISESCEVAIDLLDWTKSKEYDAIDC